MNKRILKKMDLCKWKLCLLCLLVCIGVGWALNTGPQDREIAMQATSVPKQPAANTEKQSDSTLPQTIAQVNPTVHQVTQAAVKFGVLSCLKRINQVATFLTTNNSSGVFVQRPKVPSDEHVLSTSFELIRADNATIYATASFFPNNDAVYDTIEYVEMTCERVEKEIFKDLKRIGVLKKNIIMLDGGAMKVFLMPAGSGCVVIKKEVL
jgi:hypothetical protein